MKSLNLLDKIVLEIAVEDFKEKKLTLEEATDLINRYEEKQFDILKYRAELKDVVAINYLNYLRGN